MKTKNDILVDFPSLSEEIYIECGEGWNDIIYDVFDKINKKLLKVTGIIHSFHFTQIKEKFGGLRIYYDSDDTYPSDFLDEIEDIMQEAEDKAKVTCIICGEKGELRRKNYWVYCVCEEHIDIIN